VQRYDHYDIKYIHIFIIKKNVVQTHMHIN